MSGALEDVVVLDLTTDYSAALAAAMLGDFGARVVRIDERGGGPSGRARPEDLDSEARWNYRDELIHRNKRSLALDLARAPGVEILKGLVAVVDVLVSDWPADRLATLELDAESVTSRWPRLIYARSSGFGPEGPDRDLPAIDELAAARTGMMPILPQPDQPPVYPGSGPMYTAVMLALGVLMALHHRAESGEGQAVDVSLLGGNMYGASLDLQAYLAIGGDRLCKPVSRLDAGNPMSGVLYPAADGRWIALTMPDTDRWWPGLAQIVDLDVADPRFATHELRCEKNRLELIQVLGERFRQKPSTHWKVELTRHQLSADVIEEFDYPAKDPQVFRNHYVLDLDHPSAGRVKTLGFPIYMSESPARLERLAPCVGQHSAEILRELLGYSETRIGELEESGVIA
ncbi:MAG: CaiB/BaiF CoA transferase family protein [Myxococcota bacterium]